MHIVRNTDAKTQVTINRYKICIFICRLHLDVLSLFKTKYWLRILATHGSNALYQWSAKKKKKKKKEEEEVAEKRWLVTFWSLATRTNSVLMTSRIRQLSQSCLGDFKTSIFNKQDREASEKLVFVYYVLIPFSSIGPTLRLPFSRSVINSYMSIYLGLCFGGPSRMLT